MQNKAVYKVTQVYDVFTFLTVPTPWWIIQFSINGLFTIGRSRVKVNASGPHLQIATDMSGFSK